MWISHQSLSYHCSIILIRWRTVTQRRTYFIINLLDEINYFEFKKDKIAASGNAQKTFSCWLKISLGRVIQSWLIDGNNHSIHIFVLSEWKTWKTVIQELNKKAASSRFSSFWIAFWWESIGYGWNMNLCVLTCHNNHCTLFLFALYALW